MTPPSCDIFAGPNGGGKTTLSKKISPSGEFINADNIAASMNAKHPDLGSVSMAAGKVVLNKINEKIKAKQDFAFETTLSSKQSLSTIRNAKAAGFEVSLIFVALESADLHVFRVAQRVAAGGHHIDEHVVRRRYEKSFANLTIALQIADAAIIYDNSSEDGSKEVARIAHGTLLMDNIDMGTQLGRSVRAAIALAFGE